MIVTVCVAVVIIVAVVAVVVAVVDDDDVLAAIAIVSVVSVVNDDVDLQHRHLIKIECLLCFSSGKSEEWRGCHKLWQNIDPFSKSFCKFNF